MARHRQDEASKAAMEASEAGRVLQAQRQTETVEPVALKPDSPRPPSRNEPRRLAMEEVVNRHNETSGTEVEQEPKPEPKVEPKPEPKVEDAPEPVEPAVAIEPVVEAPKTVKVKVDGEEFDASQADIDEAGGVPQYRMIKAMENRLKKVNDSVAEAKKSEAQSLQLLRAVFQQQQPQQPKLSDDEFLKQKLAVIRYGQDDEGIAAFREAIERLNPRVDSNAIEQRALARVRQAGAIEKFREEFSDVVGNPLLMRSAISLENELIAQAMQQGQMPDFPVMYRTIGNQLRSVIGPRPSQTPAPTQEQTSTPSQSDKEARKASGNVVSLPQAGARAAPTEEPKPETREETLNRMRKARGQPTL